jgi:FkbM family methyltransferase
MIRRIIDRFFIKQPRLRSRVTRLFYGDKDREVDLFGSRFVINSLRENGYVRAAHKMRFSSLLSDEVSVLLSLATLLRPGDSFVDVGANVGLFCCTLNRINRLGSEPVVRFYAYEPHPDTFRRLKMNTDGTGVTARNVAASSQNGELEFVDGAVSHVFTLAERASSYNLLDQRRRVPSIRLDSEPVEGNSIVLKIDVENQELAVLEGARNWFELERVKAVYIDGYADQQQVESFLLGFGLRFFNGRSLKPFTKGDFSMLAVSPNKYNRLQDW